MSAYEDNGYPNRHEYLKGLAVDFGIPLNVVLEIAEVLGPSEDFDGLVTELDDISDDFN